MGFLGKIKNLFNHNSNNLNLVSINDIVNVPRLKDLENEDDISSVLSCMNGCLGILKTDKTITSKTFEDEDLTKELKMITDILINTFDENPLAEELKTNEEITSEDSVVDYLKLKMYQNKLEEDAKKVYLKLIALKELIERKTFINHNKKNALINAFNNLCLTYHTYLNQSKAIMIESEAYLSNIDEEKLACEDITSRKNRAIRLSNAVIPKKLRKVLKQNLNDLELTTSIEILLEEYVYNNLDVLNKIKNDLKNPDKKYTLEKIDKLENQLIVFATFGRNLVSIDEMEEFYNLKFEIITFEKFPIATFNINKLNCIETNVYSDSIFDIINYAVNVEFLNDTEFIPVLKKVLKKDGYFDALYILEKPLILNLLLSFYNCRNSIYLERPFSKFIKKFETKYIKNNLNDLHYFEPNIVCNDSVPLATLLWLMKIKHQEKPIYISDFDNGDLLAIKLIYNIYIQKCEDFEINKAYSRYNIPDGVVSFTSPKWYHNFIEETGQLGQFVEKNMKFKHVILPDSLKEFTNYNEDVDLDISTNKGLKYFYSYGLPLEYLCIPPSVEYLYCSPAPKNIKFIDIEDSILLRNFSLFQDIIMVNLDLERVYYSPDSYLVKLKTKFEFRPKKRFRGIEYSNDDIKANNDLLFSSNEDKASIIEKIALDIYKKINNELGYELFNENDLKEYSYLPEYIIRLSK